MVCIYCVIDMATDTYVNDSGNWRKATSIYVNDAGTWRDLSKAYVNKDGTWRKVFEKAVAGRSYGFFVGGRVSTQTNIIDYIDATTTTGNATDVGDLTVSRWRLNGASGLTYGFIGGGDNAGGYTNIIDYINTTATTGNATDKGDLITARQGAGGCDGSSYAFWCGGHEV